jgi:hypothetical protein
MLSAGVAGGVVVNGSWPDGLRLAVGAGTLVLPSLAD